MTSFTSRYGDPAFDYKGAHMWAHRRHGATVIAVRGRVDSGNIAEVTDYAVRVIGAQDRVILDLSEVSAFTPRAFALLDAVDDRCAAAGALWALVGGPAVTRRLKARREWAALPTLDSLAEAELQFDEAVQRRGHYLRPLLSHPA